jgi:cytochrome c-type biogenesis protein CcmH
MKIFPCALIHFFLISLFFFSSSLADESKNETFSGSTTYYFDNYSLPPELKKRAEYLFEILRCPTCQNIPIKESYSQVAEVMKRVIIEKLKEGWTDDQIINFFVQRYGDEVLLKPKFDFFYLIPFAVLGVGILTVFLLFLRPLNKEKKGNKKGNE